jgi:hypothetical protein
LTDILFESGSRFWTGDSVLCVAGPGVSLEAHFERKVLNTDGSEVVLKVNPSPPPPPPLHPPRSTCLHALLALTPDADPAAPAPPPSPPPPLARSCRHQPRRCGAAGGSLAASTTSSSALGVCGPPSGLRHRSPGVGRRCAGGSPALAPLDPRPPWLPSPLRCSRRRRCRRGAAAAAKALASLEMAPDLLEGRADPGAGPPERTATGPGSRAPGPGPELTRPIPRRSGGGAGGLYEHFQSFLKSRGYRHEECKMDI